MSPYCPLGGGRGSVDQIYTFGVTITKMLQNNVYRFEICFKMKKFVYKNRLYLVHYSFHHYHPKDKRDCGLSAERY